MDIDTLFSNCLNDKITKEQFYIGKITHVAHENILVQFENLNASKQRILLGNIINTNTIDCFVLINNGLKILLGQVKTIKLKDNDNIHTSLKQNNDEIIYPTGKINILGSISINKDDITFNFSGFENPGLTDKVYSCPQKIIEIFNTKLFRTFPNEDNSICFGKFFNNKSPFNMAINDLYQQHLLTIGSTNSGKSTTSLSIIEKSIKKNVKYLILDTTGEYEESFKQNNIEKYKLGQDLHINNGKINITQWCEMIHTNNDSQPASLNEAIHMLKLNTDVVNYTDKSVDDIQKMMANHSHDKENFDFSKLPSQLIEYAVKPIQNNTKHTPDSFKLGTVIYLIEKIRILIDDDNFMKIFNNKDNTTSSLETILNNFYTTDNSLYINCSKINDLSIRSSFVSILITIIFEHIQHNTTKPFVLYIDEVHQYMKNKNSRTSLIRVAREGRKFGIFLSLTTQSPNDIPDILLGQIGTFIIHRLTSDLDIQKMIYFTKEKHNFQYLNQGEAIISSNHLIKDIKILINKSNLTHKNITPDLLHQNNL